MDEHVRTEAVQEIGSSAGHRYDAGDLGCGDGLPRELRHRLRAVPVGGALEVTVRDSAAKADLPPLTRMMGHRVLFAEAHPDGRLVFTVERVR